MDSGNESSFPLKFHMHFNGSHIWTLMDLLMIHWLTADATHIMSKLWATPGISEERSFNYLVAILK